MPLMKDQTQMAVLGRTYERCGGEWQEVEPQGKVRTGSVLRGLRALAATACALVAIAVIGIVATAVALVLLPVALLAVRGLGAFPAQTMETRKPR
jgi:hypothetical protein